jgi:hypothetical protein
MDWDCAVKEGRVERRALSSHALFDRLSCFRDNSGGRWTRYEDEADRMLMIGVGKSALTIQFIQSHVSLAFTPRPRTSSQS